MILPLSMTQSHLNETEHAGLRIGLKHVSHFIANSRAASHSG